jgi:alkaline phosphatase
VKRREWLRRSALAGVAGVAGVHPLAAARGRTRGPAAGSVRNIIVFAYDGMSWEDVALAQFRARRQTGRPLVLQRLLREGRSASAETYSLTSVVPDSAAAACAWSTGRKIVNGMLNLYPDATPLTTIFDVARAQGRATGLITTTRITHATPAAFIAKIDSRDREDDIALQYLSFRPDVLLGGGARHFEPGRRADGRDLRAEFAAAGYDLPATAEQLERARGARLLGVFTNDHLPFEIDRAEDSQDVPSLTRMTRKGLEVLAGADRGFVLQVEAGRIDHANHKSDYAATLHEMIEADRTLALLLDFVGARADTLLIMATDHATGGGCVYGTGTRYRDSSQAVQRLDVHTASFDRMLSRLGRTPSAAAVTDVVRSGTGVSLTAHQAEQVVAAIRDRVAIGNARAFRDQPHNSLGQAIYGADIAAAAAADRANVNFATGQHTAAPVALAVYGAAAAGHVAGLVDNTELFGWITAALGEDVQNPVMTEQQAREILTGRSLLERRPAGAHTVHA